MTTSREGSGPSPRPASWSSGLATSLSLSGVARASSTTGTTSTCSTPWRPSGGRRSRASLEAVQAPLVDLLDRGLERVRTESLALRAALTEALRALGPAATRLEKLDAALAEATEKDTSALLANLATVGAEACEQVLRQALASLPPEAPVEELARWFEPRGPLPQAVLALRRVLVGVLDFERRRLEALVVACRSAC